MKDQIYHLVNQLFQQVLCTQYNTSEWRNVNQKIPISLKPEDHELKILTGR